MPTLASRFRTLVAPALVVFLVAFVGQLAGGGFPTTLDGWKVPLLAGLFAGVIADVGYLRSHLVALAAGTPIAPIVSELSSAEPIADALLAAIEKAVAARLGVPVTAATTAADVVSDVVDVAPTVAAAAAEKAPS